MRDILAYLTGAAIGLLAAQAVWLGADCVARWIAFIVTGEFPRG